MEINESIEKKNSSTLVIVIVLLILSILVLGSYIIYDKIIDKDEITLSDKDVSKDTDDLWNYIGVWQIFATNDNNAPEEEIIIDKIDKTSVSFKYFLYRIADYTITSAPFKGNTATFTAAKGTTDDSISGTITFKNNKVILNITKASEVMRAGERTFIIKSSESILN